jgi:ribosomal-protein-alanine N-acetyltransferase
VILQTERLTLRPLAPEDANAMFALMSDPEVMAHWDQGEIADPDLVEVLLQAQVRETAEGVAFYWGVVRTGAEDFLGACDLSDIDWRHRRGEVGFMFGREAWGHGYGFEAMSSVVAHAAGLGLKRLSARTHVGNERSEALLLKLGFDIEGYLRGHIQRDGERRDCRLFGLLL